MGALQAYTLTHIAIELQFVEWHYPHTIGTATPRELVAGEESLGGNHSSDTTYGQQKGELIFSSLHKAKPSKEHFVWNYSYRGGNNFLRNDIGGSQLVVGDVTNGIVQQ